MTRKTAKSDQETELDALASWSNEFGAPGPLDGAPAFDNAVDFETRDTEKERSGLARCPIARAEQDAHGETGTRPFF